MQQSFWCKKKHRFIRVSYFKYVSFDLYMHSHLPFVALAAAKTNDLVNGVI